MWGGGVGEGMRTAPFNVFQRVVLGGGGWRGRDCQQTVLRILRAFIIS